MKTAEIIDFQFTPVLVESFEQLDKSEKHLVKPWCMKLSVRIREKHYKSCRQFSKHTKGPQLLE